jgi:UDP-N-acetylmuramyl pentapeptide phosphotransferase/UDP-N-acetylglucosamine-1-phosphate transferase
MALMIPTGHAVIGIYVRKFTEDHFFLTILQEARKRFPEALPDHALPSSAAASMPRSGQGEWARMVAPRTRDAGIAAAMAILFAAWLGAPLAIFASLICILVTLLCMPLFRAYAMARPNARSSHSTPVPQGGGAAVVIATLCAVAVDGFAGASVGGNPLPVIGGAILLIAVVGALDDIRDLPAAPRLLGQFIAVGIVVWTGLDSAQLFAMPLPLEFALLVVAGVWFVNLTNFMDGIDGITLAAFLPLAAAAVMLGDLAYLSREGGLLATFFLGALAGFVFFNFPKARLFLGDVGSLPIGLIGGALLLDLAQHGAMAAAIILPLYHFTDATLTLLLRLCRRERVWIAHRQHAYQNAVDGGWPHLKVSGIVLGLNIGLAGLAVLSVGRSIVLQAGFVMLALAAVMAVIVLFRSRKPA